MPTKPWYEEHPPEMPLKPSIYNLVIRRENNPMIRAEGGHYYGESTLPGGLTSQQLDIIRAIAGGAPVDPTDPGVQYRVPPPPTPHGASVCPDCGEAHTDPGCMAKLL